MHPQKAKKRKALTDSIIFAMAEGVICYEGNYDRIGCCGYCRHSSYKDHAEDCPVKIARELIGWPK